VSGATRIELESSQHKHPDGAAMTHYVGLDVSLKETKLHVLDEAGNRVGEAYARMNPPRSLQQCVGTLRARSVWSRDGTIDDLAVDCAHG
jgi:hypothetical protein